jgi:hypothetical protein
MRQMEQMNEQNGNQDVEIQETNKDVTGTRF